MGLLREGNTVEDGSHRTPISLQAVAPRATCDSMARETPTLCRWARPVLFASTLWWVTIAHAHTASGGATTALGAERCGSGESLLFACAYERKFASICAGRDAVIYRFGTSRSAEITISSNRHDATAFASSVVGQGSGGHQSSLRFTRDGYSYIVSAGESGSLSNQPGSSLDGVSVVEGHKDIASHDCRRMGGDHLLDAQLPDEIDPWFDRWN